MLRALREYWNSLETRERILLRGCLIFLIVFGAIAIFVLPFLFTLPSYFEVTDFSKWGPVGDTINGIAGPFIAMLVAFLTFLAFYIQYKANEQQKNDLKTQRADANKEQFQNHFFELVKLHRDNVSELVYKKWYEKELETSTGRKVFRVIFSEFIECLQEIRRFTKFHDSSKIILPKYKEKLEALIRNNNLRVDVIQMAEIDLAFNILYFGVGKESETILSSHFSRKYESFYFHKLICFFQLKPKMQFEFSYKAWSDFFTSDIKELETNFIEIYEHRRNQLREYHPLESLFNNLKLEKYYGGHQHRLSHYFRQLFQSYKFLNSQPNLTFSEKYYYGKTLRAQLSTYEQFLLFINSISSLGHKWEFTPDIENKESLDANELKKAIKENKLISNYNLIKNLPGRQFFQIRYKRYYPNVKYEADETL